MLKKTKILFAIWAVIVVIIIGLLTALGFVIKNKYEKYSVLEEKLIESAKDYAYDHVFFDPEDSYVIVTSLELVELGYLDELKLEDDECSGYVIIRNEEVKEYEAYITCQAYTTDVYKRQK